MYSTLAMHLSVCLSVCPSRHWTGVSTRSQPGSGGGDSIENFKRTKDEVECLMELAEKKFKKLIEEKCVVMKHTAGKGRV